MKYVCRCYTYLSVYFTMHFSILLQPKVPVIYSQSFCLSKNILENIFTWWSSSNLHYIPAQMNEVRIVHIRKLQVNWFENINWNTSLRLKLWKNVCIFCRHWFKCFNRLVKTFWLNAYLLLSRRLIMETKKSTQHSLLFISILW